MKYLEIELVISKDITDQLEKANDNYTCGFPEVAHHRMETAKMFCESLIKKLENKVGNCT